MRCFVVGYFCGLLIFSQEMNPDITNLSALPFHWKIYVSSSLLLPFVVITLILYWSRNDWQKHPITNNLHALAPQNSSWRAVVSSINVEFRRVDKFLSGSPGRMTYVTDSWLLKTTAYFLYVAHQENIRLNLVSSNLHDLSHESDTGTQYLSLDIISSNNGHKPFSIRYDAFSSQCFCHNIYIYM